MAVGVGSLRFLLSEQGFGTTGVGLTLDRFGIIHCYLLFSLALIAEDSIKFTLLKRLQPFWLRHLIYYSCILAIAALGITVLIRESATMSFHCPDILVTHFSISILAVYVAIFVQTWFYPYLNLIDGYAANHLT